MKVQNSTVCVVGAGNWGTSLVSALQAAGVPVPEIIGSVQNPLRKATLSAKVIWLCVPDRAIVPVTRRLVARAGHLGVDLGGKIVVHSSGALSSQVLQAAALAGASVGSVHPVMSFPTRRVVPLQGVPFGVEGDATSRRILSSLVRTMGGRPFPVPSENKALYHAIGMLASPLLVSHLVVAQEAAALAGFTPREARALIEPIAQATLTNVFSRGAAKSFSGPIARGEVATIRLHLQSLEAHPMLAAVYRSLALYALDTLPAGHGNSLRKLLRAKVNAPHERLK